MEVAGYMGYEVRVVARVAGMLQFKLNSVLFSWPKRVTVELVNFR